MNHCRTLQMIGLILSVGLGACAAPTATLTSIPPTVALNPPTIAVTSVPIPPTATSTSVPPTATSIPQTPTVVLTSTPRPTATSTPIQLSEQAQAFAEPILKAIANRPPDFADDFSTADRGWGWNRMEGQVGIVDGVIRVNGPGGSGIYRDGFIRRDFVCEFQARMSTPGSMGAFFRLQSSKAWHSVSVSSNDMTWDVNPNKGRDLVGHGNVLPLGQTNRITIIARGSQFAIYLNGQPTVYFEDATISGAGDIQLTFWGHVQRGQSDPQLAGPMQGEFDNVKLWDLDNVPGLP